MNGSWESEAEYSLYSYFAASILNCLYNFHISHQGFISTCLKTKQKEIFIPVNTKIYLEI